MSAATRPMTAFPRNEARRRRTHISRRTEARSTRSLSAVPLGGFDNPAKAVLVGFGSDDLGSAGDRDAIYDISRNATLPKRGMVDR